MDIEYVLELGDKMRGERNELLALLRRMVGEFSPILDQRTDDVICGYCRRNVDRRHSKREHRPGCAWLAAKRAVEAIDNGAR